MVVIFWCPKFLSFYSIFKSPFSHGATHINETVKKCVAFGMKHLILSTITWSRNYGEWHINGEGQANNLASVGFSLPYTLKCKQNRAKLFKTNDVIG